MTSDDLLDNLRLHGNVGTVSEVKEARLERDGTISIVKDVKELRGAILIAAEWFTFICLCRGHFFRAPLAMGTSRLGFPGNRA